MAGGSPKKKVCVHGHTPRDAMDTCDQTRDVIIPLKYKCGLIHLPMGMLIEKKSILIEFVGIDMVMFYPNL